MADDHVLVQEEDAPGASKPEYQFTSGDHGPSDELTRRHLMELSEDRFLRTRSDALVTIAEAVGTGAGAHDWARVDLGLVFSDDAVIHPDADKTIRRISLSESIRNVGVFFPLLITWIGIATATLAYGQLVSDHPAAARKPFIQLWEQRFVFGNESPKWWVPSFSTIGFIDALAIFAVLLLSIWVAVERRRLDVRITSEEAEVQNRLASTIGDAAVILARRSLASPTAFNETMTDVAKRMDQVNTRMTTTARAAQETLAKGTEVLAGIDAVSVRLADAAGAIAASLQAIEPVLRDTHVELQQVASAERDLIGEVTAGVAGFSSSQSALSSSSRALSDATDRIDSSFNAGLSAATEMRSAATSTSEDLNKAATELKQLKKLIEPLTAIVASLQETAQTVPGAASQLQGSAEKLDGSAGNLSKASQNIGELPALLREATAQMQATLDAQQSTMENLGLIGSTRRLHWWSFRAKRKRSRSIKRSK